MCVSLPTHLCTQETKSKSLLSLISFTGTNSGILAEVYTHAPKENFIEGLNYISTTQKALAFPQFIPNKNVFFVKFAKTPFTILLRFPHGGHVSIESPTSFLRTFTNTGSIARSSWRRCTANKPRVKRWTTKARQRSNWQRTHVVTSACRLHFLNLSLPPFHSTMEHIWERNSVTLDVICRLLLPRLSLPPFLCILPPHLSRFTSGLNYSTPVCLCFCACEIKEALKNYIVLKNCIFSFICSSFLLNIVYISSNTA